MSGIAGSEVILLIIIGLVVLGPKRLPQVANQIGSWLGQARRMTRMMKRQLEEEVNFDINAELGLKPDTTAKPTANGSSSERDQERVTEKTTDVSSPKYVHERATEKTANTDDEATVELPDDYSPAHDAGAPGSGVGDDADYIDDDELEPVATAAVGAEEVDAPVSAEIAEPQKKESA